MELRHSTPTTTQHTHNTQHTNTQHFGCECVAHAVQALIDVDRRATILSIDGIGVFDLVSGVPCWKARGQSTAALPFGKQFYGSPSRYIWEDEKGFNHDILQGEGGEQGDPLMPTLLAALTASRTCMHHCRLSSGVMQEYRCIKARHSSATMMPRNIETLTAAARTEDECGKVTALAPQQAGREAFGHTAGSCCPCAGSVGNVVDFT